MYQKSENSQAFNLSLWDSVCVTDPEVTKQVNVGRRFTAICAQSQIKQATKLWGSMGGEWGIRSERYDVIENYCLYAAELYYPGGCIQIHADTETIFYSGKRKGMYNEDFTKKVATDALTKGLSWLGFNADIFEGKFDDNKYVAELRAQKKDKGGERVGEKGGEKVRSGRDGRGTGGQSDKEQSGGGEYKLLREELSKILEEFPSEKKRVEDMAGKFGPKDIVSLQKLINTWNTKKQPEVANAQDAVQKVFGDDKPIDNPDNKVPDDFKDDIPF